MPEVLRLVDFLSKNPSYAEEGVQVLYSHLIDQENLSLLTKISEGSTPPAQRVLELATLALQGILQRPGASKPRVTRLIVEWWPNLCLWIDALTVFCIAKSSPFGEDFRSAVLVPIAQFFALLALTEGLRVPQTVKAAFDLWANIFGSVLLENALARQGRLVADIKTAVLLISDAFSTGTRKGSAAWAATKIIHDSPLTFVYAALYHITNDALNHSATRDGSIEHIHSAAVSLHILNNMCRIVAFRGALQYQHTVKITMFILAMATVRPFKQTEAQKVLSAISGCVRHLSIAAEAVQGKNWVWLAIQNDLFRHYALASPWIVWGFKQGGGARQEALYIATSLNASISPYLIYRPVLCTAVNALKNAAEAAKALSFEEMGPLSRSWQTLVHTVREWDDVMQKLKLRPRKGHYCRRANVRFSRIILTAQKLMESGPVQEHRGDP